MAMTSQRRFFSSGIRPILKALVNIKNKEEANVANKLFKKVVPKEDIATSSQEQKDPTENLSLVVKAELERRVSNPAKKKVSPPPVSAWKTTAGWGCIKGCGACCHLDKGPQYPPVEDFLTNPEEVAQFKSMVGKDGWCKHFDKTARQCTIYKDRPRFCRVEPVVLKDLFDIPEHKVDKEVCSLCRDSISEVYGCKSKEMKNFERLIGSIKSGQHSSS